MDVEERKIRFIDHSLKLSEQSQIWAVGFGREVVIKNWGISESDFDYLEVEHKREIAKSDSVTFDKNISASSNCNFIGTCKSLYRKNEKDAK